MALSADESFATLSEADTYAAARNWADWIAAAAGAREGALREATDYIVATTRWPGSIIDADQTLPFPRSGAYDSEGRYIDGTPAKLKSATIEAARLALTAPLLGGPVTAVVKAERVGPISTEYAATTAAEDRNERLGWVRQLLRAAGAIGGPGSLNVRLLKA